MTNNIVSIDFNGVKFLKDSTTKLKRLTLPANTAADATYTDSETGADYQVPTGKKFTVIYIESWDITTGPTGDLIYADNADGVTNAVTLWSPQTGTAISNLIFISAEVPAAKYINFNYTSHSMESLSIIYGVEETA